MPGLCQLPPPPFLTKLQKKPASYQGLVQISAPSVEGQGGWQVHGFFPQGGCQLEGPRKTLRGGQFSLGGLLSSCRARPPRSLTCSAQKSPDLSAIPLTPHPILPELIPLREVREEGPGPSLDRHPPWWHYPILDLPSRRRKTSHVPIPKF